MVLEIPGSTPGAHPLLQDYAGLSPSGKAQAFDACISLVRIQLALFETLAQSVEHLTFNQVVAGSIPACLIPEREICGCGGIGRRARFRFWWATVQVQVLSSAG